MLSIAPAGVFNIQVSAASDYFTEGYYTYRITNGNAEIISVDKSISGYVVIPSELGGYPVTSIGLIYTICDVFEDCTKITGVSIPNGVTVIGLGAFSGCSNLANVTIPASVTYIDYRAFEDCPLTDVYISDIAAWVGITFMDSVWEWDNYSPTTLYLNGVPITELHIPDGVTSINNYAFYNCDSLTKVTIPNSVANIGWYAFEKCSNLANVSIGDGVTSISYGAFMSCKALREVTIGKSVTTIGNYAFYECEKLENIELPESVISIGEDAFRDCESLLSINIPKNVTTIGNAAFLWCSSLTSITIPDGVSKIEGYVFADCFDLKTITIPASITSIGDDAFYNCRSLKTVFFKGTQEQKETILIGTDNNALNYAQWHYEVENTFFANQECYYCKECNNYYLYDGSYATATVVFKNWDGTELSRKNYRYNDEITVPPTPQKQSDSTFEYTFIGWDKEVVNCAGDAVYTAVYTPQYIDYTVSFKDWDGTVLSSKTYHYGDVVTEPASPTRVADNTYTYTFKGWDKDVENCAGDATYTAQYTATYKDYTVIFKNWDGTVLSSKTYHYGDVVTEPASPTRVADNTYTYTFKGWDKSVVNCAGNTTYTAMYTPTYIDYTVTFKNWNGMVLSTKTYHYGDKVTVPATPTKAADQTYTYTFKGWDKSVVACAGNATYTATYTPVYIDYTVTFKNWNGTVLSSKTYHYGDKVTVPTTPTRAADNTYTYTFKGWDKSVVNCAGNATYTAIYTPVHIEYTVVFKDWNGNEISNQVYHYGDTIVAPINPVRPADNTFIYIFAGWDKTVASCEGDTVFIATYKATYIEYTITFKNWDGTIISANKYHFGDTVVEPETPERASDGAYTYTFVSWDKGVSICLGNETYTAVFASTSCTYSIGGTVVSYLTDGEVTIELFKDGQATSIDSLTLIGKKGLATEYSFSNVASGNYIMKISKANHVTRTYEVTIGSTDVTQVVKICPKGDVTGDGVVNIKDFQRLLRHVNKTNPLTDYELACGDVTGDGVCNIKDFQRLLRHVNKTNPLF